MSRPVKKILHYLILCLVLASALFLLLIFNGSPNSQKLIVVLSCAWYVVWGHYHHSRENTLDTSVIFEYLTYSLLGGALVFGLL